MHIVVTGSSSGFGELIAKTLATAGHHIYATMRNVQSSNAQAAQLMHTWARQNDLRLEVLEMDVTRRHCDRCGWRGLAA